MPGHSYLSRLVPVMPWTFASHRTSTCIGMDSLPSKPDAHTLTNCPQMDDHIPRSIATVHNEDSREGCSLVASVPMDGCSLTQIQARACRTHRWINSEVLDTETPYTYVPRVAVLHVPSNGKPAGYYLPSCLLHDTSSFVHSTYGSIGLGTYIKYYADPDLAMATLRCVTASSGEGSESHEPLVICRGLLNVCYKI